MAATLAIKDNTYDLPVIKSSTGPEVLDDVYSDTLQAMGFPASMFTVPFTLARTAGRISQWKELFEDRHRKIGRPRQLYTGTAQREYVPIEKRG